MQPISSLIENQKGDNLSDVLNYHIIKWCKLYLDDSGSSWTMPNREKGLYRAWQHLITFDPALSKTERKVLKDWPQDAQGALTKALSELEFLNLIGKLTLKGTYFLCLDGQE